MPTPVTVYLSGISLIVQYLNNLGLLAAGGTLNTYVGGSVNTPVATYTDSTGTVLNANPMTLSSAARPAAASGAPVAFWVPGGTLVKLVVTDAAGNALVQLDNVPAINDLTNSTNALQTLLASPASSNSSGVGPVAGADLVANAVKSYDVFADVRTANAPSLAVGQTLTIAVQGAQAVDDGLGGDFYWASGSSATDDGRNVLKPNSVSAAGRYLRLFPLGVPQTVVKPTDQSLNTQTVLQNDTAVTLALPAGTYWVQLRALIAGTGGTGQGYKVNLNFTGTTGAPNGGTGISIANAVAALTPTCQVGTPITAAAVSSGAEDACTVDLIFQATSQGSLTLQFAQNSSSANPTIMKAGTMLSATRVA